MCIANYEPSGSQVQLTLERGLPAMIASFTSKQLPYPSLSFDMLHCARCGIDWDQKGILQYSISTSYTGQHVWIIFCICSTKPFIFQINTFQIRAILQVLFEEEISCHKSKKPKYIIMVISNSPCFQKMLFYTCTPLVSFSG